MPLRAPTRCVRYTSFPRLHLFARTGLYVRRFSPALAVSSAWLRSFSRDGLVPRRALTVIRLFHAAFRRQGVMLFARPLYLMPRQNHRKSRFPVMPASDDGKLIFTW